MFHGTYTHTERTQYVLTENLKCSNIFTSVCRLYVVGILVCSILPFNYKSYYVSDINAENLCKRDDTIFLELFLSYENDDYDTKVL